MSKVFIEESTLTDIGDAIRAKANTTDLIPPLDMAEAIANLPSGGGKLKYVILTRTADGVFDLSPYVANVSKATWFMFVRQPHSSGTVQRGDYAMVSPLLGSTYNYTGHVYTNIYITLGTPFTDLIASSSSSKTPLLNPTSTPLKAVFDTTNNTVELKCNSSSYSAGSSAVLFYIGE